MRGIRSSLQLHPFIAKGSGFSFQIDKVTWQEAGNCIVVKVLIAYIYLRADSSRHPVVDSGASVKV
jgi:hypothetical protein